MKEKEITWNDVHTLVKGWAHLVRSEFDAVVGISRGGIVPGFLLSEVVGLPFKAVEPFMEGGLKEFKGKKIIIIDDIEETGTTLNFFREQAHKYELADFVSKVIVKKPKEEWNKVWYTFPWETEADTSYGREQATVAILRSIHENPLREGLKDTPKRVARMWGEFSTGYGQKPEEMLQTKFSAGTYDQMVVLKDIDFYSICEHHLLPFYGKVHFAYIPDKKVVGLSKIPRLVEVFSRRLQLQEQLTEQIGMTFERLLEPKGVGVVVEAIHLCQVVRGVKQQNAKMVTSYLGGGFKKDMDTRSEFLRLIGK